MKRRELDILFVGTRVVLLFWVTLHISDLGLYLEYARKSYPGHQWPYINFDFEYPPLAYLLMAVPGWIHTLLGLNGVEAYRILFGFCLLPMDVLLYLRFRKRPPIPNAAFVYVILSSALGFLIYDRIDLAVGFTLAWPFLSDRPSRADSRFALWWAIGGILKLVPILAAPVRMMEWQGPMKERLLRSLKFGAIVACPIILSCAILLLMAGGKISFLSHHSDRGVQIESLLGSLVMLSNSFTHFETKVDWNFGAQHLAPIPGMVLFSRILFYGSLILTYALLAIPKFRRDSLSGTWMILSAFVTFGYVLSPQFLFWLVPLGICAASRIEAGRRRSQWLWIFGLAVAITGNHFRYYFDYVIFHHFAVLQLFLRNILLVVLWILSWRWMGRTAPKVQAMAAQLEFGFVPTEQVVKEPQKVPVDAKTGF